MSQSAVAPLRRDFLYLVIVPFLVWVICFWGFLSGRLALTEDAISYYDHTGYFSDNIIHGVYPLWNSLWFDGAPYNFFLRRIGEVNPFYWVMGLLKVIGVPHLYAYLVFLAAYFFLAVTGFWLIAKIILKDRLASTGAFLLLLFSGWGSQVFYNYIDILFVPLIWFFYFLLAFAHEGKKHQFLGIFFTVGLLVSTYIPFFFLTVLAIFGVLSCFFFPQAVTGLFSRVFGFIRANKRFAFATLIFFCVACIPALDFFHESKAGEFVMPGRNIDSVETSPLAVGLAHVKVGDLLAQGYFDKTFMDHASLVPGDFFISYVFFLAAIIAVINPLTRASLFLLANIATLGIICMTDTTPVYRFLYDHIFFFRYMRMISYFFWIAILPMMILLVMGQMKTFINKWRGTANVWILTFIVAAHILFAMWALPRESIAWTSWAAIGLSLVFFVGTVLPRWDIRILTWTFLFAVLVQPLQMCGYIAGNSAPSSGQIHGGALMPPRSFVFHRKPLFLNIKDEDKDPFLLQVQKGIYYGSRWYSDIYTHVPFNDRENFTSNKLYLFDNVAGYENVSPGFFISMGKLWREGKNIALLDKAEVRPGELRAASTSAPLAETVGQDSSSVKVASFDANTLSLKTHLDRPKFLLWTDSYHSGWHVYINGQEGHLIRADYAFKGAWIPAGDNHVVFRYSKPIRYAAGYLLLLFFVATLAVIGILAGSERLFIEKGPDYEF